MKQDNKKYLLNIDGKSIARINESGQIEVVYNCDPAFDPTDPPSRELIEGVDFRLQKQYQLPMTNDWYNCTDPNDTEFDKVIAIPLVEGNKEEENERGIVIVPAEQTQEQLWEEVKSIVCYQPESFSTMQLLKSKFTITRK